MNTPTTETCCAWCAAERGEAGGPGTSHGICERHAEQLRYQALAMRNDPRLRISDAECVPGDIYRMRGGMRVSVPTHDEPGEDYAAHGHRPDQIAFSVFVCLACGALGFVLGIAVAVWGVTQ